MSCGTHHLQPILPKLLLVGLIEEGKVADVVDEDVAQDRQVRIDGGHLAIVRFEGSAKAAQSGRGGQLGDLMAHLAADELTLEVCDQSDTTRYREYGLARRTVLLLACQDLARRGAVAVGCGQPVRRARSIELRRHRGRGRTTCELQVRMKSGNGIGVTTSSEIARVLMEIEVVNQAGMRLMR